MCDLDELFRTLKTPLDEDMLAPLSSQCECLQFAEPLRPQEYERVAEFLQDYPNIKLRAFHYDAFQDLSFLRHFQSVRRFQIDCWELRSLQGIEYLPDNLECFSLGQTRTRAISLRPLGRFASLRELYLEGQTKNFDVVSQLRTLEKLTLRSITLPTLEPLTPLKNLWWLAIKLGGTKDLSLLPRIGRLKYLELWLIRGLADIRPIADLEHLQYLFLQALRNVERLPPLGRLTKLRLVYLETMRGLRDLSPLLGAPRLEELMVVAAEHMQPDDFRCLVAHPTLRHITAGLGSDRKNRAVKELFPPPRFTEAPRRFEFD